MEARARMVGRSRMAGQGRTGGEGRTVAGWQATRSPRAGVAAEPVRVARWRGSRCSCSCGVVRAVQDPDDTTRRKVTEVEERGYDAQPKRDGKYGRPSCVPVSESRANPWVAMGG